MKIAVVPDTCLSVFSHKFRVNTHHICAV